MKKWISLMAMALVLSLGFSACAPKPAANPTTPAPSSEAPATEATPAEAPKASEPATAADDAWEKIKAAGVITVGNSPDYEPYEYEDGNGNVIGFDIDLLDALCKELGIKYELKTLAFDNIITAVQTGNVNIGMSGFTITEDRKSQVLFTTPYYSSAQVMIVNKDSGFATAEDINKKGVRVAAGMGTSGEAAAQEFLPETDITGMDNYALAFAQLKNKATDVVVADKPVGETYAAKDGFLVLEKPLTQEDNAIVIKNGDDSIVQAINGALEKLQKDGTIEALAKKWIEKE